jgi:chorismate dehydratase
MKKIKLSVISYLNTKPFLYGINNSDFIKKNSVIEMDFPSACAQKLKSGQTDIGIVPVALLSKLEKYFIVSDFCISTDRKMPSVLLSSQVPLEKIEKIFLDYQSMTSVNLTKILIEKYWKISPEIIDAKDGYENLISGTTAGVIIGDRALLLSHKFRYNYDLSDEWYNFTGMPFVFACWVSTKEIDENYIEEFNKALGFGLDHIPEVAAAEAKDERYKGIDLMKYLSEDLNFRLDSEKRKSMDMYLNYLKSL